MTDRGWSLLESLRRVRSLSCAEFPLHLCHCEKGVGSAISTSHQSEIGTTMSQILNLSRHASDEEAQLLTSLLIYPLVEQSGGQVHFTAEEIHQMREKLASKMVQIQLGDELRLRIIDRLPELQ